jgi:hypothetical protein
MSDLAKRCLSGRRFHAGTPGEYESHGKPAAIAAPNRRVEPQLAPAGLR